MSYNELKAHGRPDFPIELYTVDPRHPKYEMAHHWHSSVELLHVRAGKLTLTLNNCVLEGGAGDVFFINSEVIHGATPHDCVYECLVLSLPFLRTGNHDCDTFLDDLSHQSIRIHRRLQGASREAALSLFSVMHRAQGLPCGGEFLILGAAHTLLGVLRSTGEWISDGQAAEHQDEKSIVRLKKTLIYIREHFDQPITTEAMAAVTGLSPKYFCTFFKQMTGKTPTVYLTDYRIERAARMLLMTDTPVSQIAYASGFNDLSYFIKTFKTRMGTTPRLYRKTTVEEGA